MLSHTGCAVGQVWLGAAPRENAAHRIRTLRRGAASQTRRWPTRDIRLSGFHAHQRQDPRRRVHHPPQNVAQEIPSPTRRTQRDAIAAMSRRPGAGRRVAAKCVSRLVSVLCCPRQWRTPAAVPRCDPSHVATQPPASQPTRPPPDLGKVLQALQALASDSEDPSPLSQREVCMSTSKVRTVCGSSARTDLCGGRSERPSLPRLNRYSKTRGCRKYTSKTSFRARCYAFHASFDASNIADQYTQCYAMRYMSSIKPGMKVEAYVVISGCWCYRTEKDS